MFTILYILEIGTFVMEIMSERGRGHETIACGIASGTGDQFNQ